MRQPTLRRRHSAEPTRAVFLEEHQGVMGVADFPAAPQWVMGVVDFPEDHPVVRVTTEAVILRLLTTEDRVDHPEVLRMPEQAALLVLGLILVPGEATLVVRDQREDPLGLVQGQDHPLVKVVTEEATPKK